MHLDPGTAGGSVPAVRKEGGAEDRGEAPGGA